LGKGEAEKSGKGAANFPEEHRAEDRNATTSTGKGKEGQWGAAG